MTATAYLYTVATDGPAGYAFASLEAGSPSAALLDAFDAAYRTIGRVPGVHVSGLSERFTADDGAALRVALAPGSRVRVTREDDGATVYDEPVDFARAFGAPWCDALDAAWGAAKEATR